MLRLFGVVLTVGLADGLNPTTVGPALYLATVHRRRVRVAQFTVGVFTVNAVAGVVLTIGPGRFLLGLVPHPQRTVRHVIKLVAGVVLLAAAVVASPASVPMEIVLLLVYNAAFVLPLLAILVVLLVGGERADRWLQAGGAWLQRRWPVVLATLLLLVGGGLTVVGGTGLVKQ